MIRFHRIPAGYELTSRKELWSLFLYRSPFRGLNGRRVVWRWRGSQRLSTCLLIAALLGLFALAGAADRASASAPPQGWGAAEIEAAQDYWGGATPALGCTTYSIRFDVPDAEMELLPSAPSLLGEATVPTHLRGGVCALRMRYIKDISILEQCYAVVHEYGHLLGMEHSTDSSSIMYPTVEPYIGGQVVPPCDALAPHRSVLKGR